MKDINKDDYQKINGGSFGFDIGWFLGNSINGNFLTSGGCADAVTQYVVFYATH
ncbi:MAG: hypothetical protein K0M50_09475 [Prolixibacteraceae bacterium]|nr:hypothetical protein [Prolixibacteraceae bacterium]